VDLQAAIQYGRADLVGDLPRHARAHHVLIFDRHASPSADAFDPCGQTNISLTIIASEIGLASNMSGNVPDNAEIMTQRTDLLVSRLQGQLDGAAMLVGNAVEPRYGDDLSGRPGARPGLVLRPRDTADVSIMLKAC